MSPALQVQVPPPAETKPSDVDVSMCNFEFHDFGIVFSWLNLHLFLGLILVQELYLSSKLRYDGEQQFINFSDIGLLGVRASILSRPLLVIERGVDMIDTAPWIVSVSYANFAFFPLAK